ncbi:MAG: protein disulfide oxidoreductase [Gammaproteobacteria bacterium]|nr:protein disulfide oxidoreductase [Gammaproteobacteria bacterium]
MFRSFKKKLNKNRWFSIVLNILFIAILFYALSSWQTKDAARGEATNISGDLITGEKFNLQHYRGQPVLIHFWATWCPICKLENNSIAAIAEDYQIITVASWSDSDSAIKKFLQEENLNLPVITDHDGEWAKLYGVKAVPTSFVLDGEGHIRFVETGFTTELGLRLRLWWSSK